MKLYRLSIKNEAIQDIQISFDWYESRLGGLGKRFIFA